MEFSKEYSQQIIDRIFDLYLIQHKRYLMQHPGGKYNQNSAKMYLNRYQLLKHLKGDITIGTFAGTYLTKFLCFDLDFSNPDDAKSVAYKLGKTLDDLRVHNYYISSSGKKGYHIEIFLDDAISVQIARKFYRFVLERMELPSDLSGRVEYRPSAAQGVKLPLGIHQGTGRFCGFCCISDGLEMMDREKSFSYFLEIEKTRSSYIQDIVVNEYTCDVDQINDMEDIMTSHNYLRTYEQNEDYSMNRAFKLYNHGLSGSGQRHKSFMLLARFMNHRGDDKNLAIKSIMEWLERQNRSYYSSTSNECLKDAKLVVEFVYSKNLTLTTGNRDLIVRFDEVDTIIQHCAGKNQKKLMYAILIHSKRWGMAENGEFYMTFQQMEETANIDARTAMRLVKELENLKLIEVVKRNQKQQGTSKKLPNVYRVLLNVKEQKDESEIVERKSEIFKIKENSSFRDCLGFFYDDKVLKKILPRRQYEALIEVTA